MKIAVIGAGFAGIAAAKVLTQVGHQITVFEKAPDVGGVWSSTRRYPGLKTQNNKGTYHLSDLKMPRSYPEWPRGKQVQKYLESYVAKFGLAPLFKLGVQVTHAELVEGESGWRLTFDGRQETFDHLVVANGIYSQASIPPFEGVDELESAGGRLLVTGDLKSLDEVAGKHVVLVGYGKSSCDVAVEVAKVAASTTVVARELLWKVPYKLKGVVNQKWLLLTRLGENLFPYQTLRGPERILHANDSRIAHGMFGSVEKLVTKQLHLRELGLVPEGPFHSIAKASVSLATDGFYEAVDAGTIDVLRSDEVSRFLEKDGKPWAQLRSGRVIPAEVVICGTGWKQDVPFFDESIQRRLTDERGNFQLYRQILPLDVPHLTFAGYNSSFFSPLSAEMASVWIASYLGGNHSLPPKDEMRSFVAARVAWMEERTGGNSARGTNVIPFSMHNIDEVLNEIGLNVRRGTRARQWLVPVNPRSYRKVTSKLARRLAAAT
jgi:cation diffusion facilitator CzcD-associated flavoprotein CzcO